eukprot:CAMPEP_0176463900 /NCGR_PEP_ID=MMETSP0127-20121128/36177_1 /TAXON_ID=938130 /ORGANISM="Platyophrya macrostoma, Strain WH" /LENGTH=1348 /DNA_ID=CAMNT_0017856175 /DNA_START=9 /DNA_END=4055 /DNA_ORIENTATION=+
MNLPPPPSYEELFGGLSTATVVQPPSVTLRSETSTTIQFTLNGTPVTVDFSKNTSLTPNTTLAEYLRTTTFTGTKIFCHEGGCGVCVVSVTYTDLSSNETVTRSIHSCLRPLATCNGLSIVTNDGLGNAQTGYHPIQKALAQYNGSQCGFCSNGFVMTMYSLLSENPNLTPLQIEQAFDGNLCRCTGYRPILDAMKTFATVTDDGKPKDGHCEDEDSCRKTGCKRSKAGTLPFPDVEDVSSFLPKLEPYRHVAPKKHVNIPLRAVSSSSAAHRLVFEENGTIWQDCPTLTDLNTWLPWYVSEGYDPMLVVAQTSLGVYPTPAPQVKLNINAVPEFHQVSQSSAGITVGSATTISSLISILRNAKGDQAYQTAHFSQAALHLQRIASHPLRNIASIFGNIAVTVRHQSTSNYFCGDGATVLYGLGTTFLLYDTVAQTNLTLTMGDLFDTDLKGKYCISLTIPWALENEHFMSYKIAMRQVNAHSYLNAAMRCVVNPTTKAIQGSPYLVFGGVNSKPTRFTSVETAMVGVTVTDGAAFQSLATTLSGLLNPTVFMGKQAFRKSVALNYFYKFFLFLQGASVPTALQTGVQCWFTRPESSGTQVFQPNPAEYPVSIGIPKLESLQQTSGHAKYTEDLARPVGTVYACVVLATQANCQIASIDASAAQAMPGFVAILTAADMPTGTNAWQMGEILSSGQINYHGQSIAVVLATTQRRSWECADAVVVTYKNVATPITTIAQAVAANSFIPASATPPAVTRGNATQAMATAQTVVSGSISLGYQYHFHMENQAVLVIPREDVLEVHSATQMLVPLQQQVSAVTGYPMSKVVVSVKRCGGGFGGKLSNSILPASIAAFCAVKLGCPVHLTVDLQQTTRMLGCRSGKVMDYTVGVNNDGTIVALNANVICAAGVNPTDVMGTDVVTIHSLDNAYYIPNANISGQMVTMNIPSSTAVRGPGWVPGIHFGESIISAIASKLNMDPVAVREKNFFTKGQTTCDGMILTYWDMPAIWSQLKQNANYTARVAAVDTFNTNNRWIKRGLAMTPCRFGVGQSGANFDCVVNIYPDGTVSITHGGAEIGQGINTKVIQVAALKLGITQDNLSLICVNETSTRSCSAASNVTGGSITSELCALAVMHACETLQRRIAPFRQANQTWQQLIGACSGAGIELTATGFTNAPVNTSGIFNYNSNGAALSEVELDVLTGQIEVRQVDIVFDCGISLNPTIDIGQLEGGFLFGLGYYLQEDPSWDPTTGAPNQGSTWEYKPPCAYDVPISFNIALLKNAPNPVGVLGSKATGEPGVALASSVVQAVESAVTAARAANGLGSTRWVATSLPLTVDVIQQACGTVASNLAF